MSSQDACLGYLGAVLFGKKKKPEIKLGSGKRERESERPEGRETPGRQAGGLCPAPPDSRPCLLGNSDELFSPVEGGGTRRLVDSP